MDKIVPGKTSKINKTHFGSNLRFLRRLNALSQKELGEKINLSRSKIASYESGVIEPKLKSFISICEHFENAPRVMLDELLSALPAELERENNAVDLVIKEKLDDFIKQTNEMTKIYDGYTTFLDIKKDTEEYKLNGDLYASLHDILKVLETLISANWKLIQRVYPNE